MSEITAINHRALAHAVAELRKLEPAPLRTVLLLSPSLDDVEFLGREFPEARLFIATRGTWDLNVPFPLDAGVDVVVASNVFHYSPEPARWFSNVLGMTRYLVLQDLVFRRRSATPDGLCDDGDAVRYAFRSRGVDSAFAGAYDLSPLEPHIKFFLQFEGGRNEHHAPPLAPPSHYCAVIQAPAAASARPPLAGMAALPYRLPMLRRRWRLALRRVVGSR